MKDEDDVVPNAGDSPGGSGSTGPGRTAGRSPQADEELQETVLMPALAAKDSDEEQAPSRTGMARLRASFMRPSRGQAIAGVLLALVGFTAVVQVRTTNQDETYEGRREEDLIQIFNGLTGTSDRTRREIERLEQTRRDLLVDSSAREAAVEQAQQRLDTLNILAGVVPVTGPGLRVTITEGDGRVSLSSLLDMVEELRTAGAESMEFNDDVRLVASSYFELEDGQVTVDGERLSSPYVLEVIGEPNTLHTGLTFPSGPVSQLRKSEGAEVSIEELDRVDITSTVSSARPEFAEPSEGQ